VFTPLHPQRRDDQDCVLLHSILLDANGRLCGLRRPQDNPSLNPGDPTSPHDLLSSATLLVSATSGYLHWKFLASSVLPVPT